MGFTQMLSKHSLVSQNVIRAINFERGQFQLTTKGFEPSSSDPESDTHPIPTNHEGIRTLNLLIRSQTPYPLGHVASV